jgi:hypothetical protein
MSTIYFHSEHDGTAQVRGTERANMDFMLESTAKGALDLTMGFHLSDSRLYDRLVPFVNPEGRLADANSKDFDERLAYVMVNRSFSDYTPTFALKGKPIKLTSLIANTVLAVGSDPARLNAKIHYTCESHGYVQGFHRKWLADVIQEGLDELVFRRGYWAPKDLNADLKTIIGQPTTEEERKLTFHSFGWDTVVDLLRASSKGPVVMSFSVTDGFPNSHTGDWMPVWPEGVEKKWDALTEAQQKERQDREEGWDCLSEGRQWAISTKGLKDPNREYFNQPLTPQNLRTYRFGHELSFLDLLHGDMELIAGKLGVTL